MIATTKELKLIDKTSGEFSRKVLAPGREENDAYPFGPFFTEVVEKAFELDFFHTTLPEKLGGIGHGIKALCVLLENICREDSSLGGLIFNHTFSQELMLAAKGEDLLQSIVENAKQFQNLIIAYPLLDNPSEIKDLPQVKEEKGKTILTGSLSYLVTGNLASNALIPATGKEDAPHSYFLINLNDTNIKKSGPVISHGLHACPAVDIELNNVEASLIGQRGEGPALFEKTSNKLQIAIAAMAAGIMKGSFQEAAAYCKDRNQGGRTILNWSEIQMMLADMAIKINIADLSIKGALEAMEKKEKGWENMVQAATLHIQKSATDLTTDGIQALGGVGYMKDFGQEKRFRDAGQIQAFLGIQPMKKIRFIKRVMSV